MGASHEVGWNESCFWGFAVSPMVQSIHRPPSAASVAVDPESPWRVRVFCLTSKADWNRPPTLGCVPVFCCGKDRPLLPEAVLLVWVTERRAATVEPRCIMTTTQLLFSFLTCCHTSNTFDAGHKYPEQLEYLSLCEQNFGLSVCFSESMLKWVFYSGLSKVLWEPSSRTF